MHEGKDNVPVTARTTPRVAIAFCLVAILLHLAAFFLPVVYLGKFEAMFQQVPAVLTTGVIHRQ